LLLLLVVVVVVVMVMRLEKSRLQMATLCNLFNRAFLLQSFR